MFFRQNYTQKKRYRIGCFCAASNVTGIITDTNHVTALLHKYGALAFWDFATAGKLIYGKGVEDEYVRVRVCVCVCVGMVRVGVEKDIQIYFISYCPTTKLRPQKYFADFLKHADAYDILQNY